MSDAARPLPSMELDAITEVHRTIHRANDLQLQLVALIDSLLMVQKETRDAIKEGFAGLRGDISKRDGLLVAEIRDARDEVIAILEPRPNGHG